MIAIVDYGAANLLSISRALEAVGATTYVTSDPDEIIAAEGVVLPGVGAAGSAMVRLTENGVDEALRFAAKRGTPLLGLCLGMQLFFDWLAEDDVAGLGLLPGRVESLPAGRKVPHMGWNSLSWTSGTDGSELFDGLGPATYVYFVHSYHCLPGDPERVVAWTSYGDQSIVAAVTAGNVQGLQFHPEKSGPAGLAILRNWLGMVRSVHTDVARVGAASNLVIPSEVPEERSRGINRSPARRTHCHGTIDPSTPGRRGCASGPSLGMTRPSRERSCNGLKERV